MKHERKDCLLYGEEQTQRLGWALGRCARPGDVLALVGDLGAGKTTLTQSFARALGVPEETPVVSPTYTLVHTYPGELELIHLDLYRLAEAGELFDLGFDEMLDRGGVVVAEWADRFPEAFPQQTLWLHLEWVDSSCRALTLKALPEVLSRFETALDGLEARS